MQVFCSSDQSSPKIMFFKVSRWIGRIFRHRMSRKESLDTLASLISILSKYWEKSNRRNQIQIAPHLLHIFSEISSAISVIMPKRLEFSIQIIHSAYALLSAVTDSQHIFFSLFYFAVNFCGFSSYFVSVLRKIFFWFSEWIISTFSIDHPLKESAGKIEPAGGLKFLQFVGSVGHLLGVLMSFDLDKEKNSLLQLYVTKVIYLT